MAQRERGKNQTWTINLLLNFRSVLFTSKIKSKDVVVALKQERLDCFIKLMTLCYFPVLSAPFSEKRKGENGLDGRSYL